MNLHSLHWAAGFLEGEGSFMNQRNQVCVSAVQVQREPLERLQKLFGGKIYKCAPKNSLHQCYFKWNTLGSRGAGVAMTLYTLLSPRRQQQVEKALAKWKSVPCRKPSTATHCPHGHAYDEANTYTYEAPTTLRIYRVCRACRNVARDRKVAARKMSRVLSTQ